jgi:hypothetical protein
MVKKCIIDLVVQGHNLLSRCSKLPAVFKSAASWSGMGDEDAVGECADKAVSLMSEHSRDASVCRSRSEGREDEQPPAREGWLKFRLQAHSCDASCRNPDYGLAATEQDSKALPFHNRVKAAN